MSAKTPADQAQVGTFVPKAKARMEKLEKEVGDREKLKDRKFQLEMSIDSAAMKKKVTLAAEQSNLPNTAKNHLKQ